MHQKLRSEARRLDDPVINKQCPTAAAHPRVNVKPQELISFSSRGIKSSDEAKSEMGELGLKVLSFLPPSPSLQYKSQHSDTIVQSVEQTVIMLCELLTNRIIKHTTL